MPSSVTLTGPVFACPSPTKTPADVRVANMSDLLRLIRAYPGQSRASLTAVTRLAKATVSTLVAELMSRGLVTEDDQPLSSTGGRPGTPLRVIPDAVHTVGLDISVKALYATVIDLSGHIVNQHTVPLEVDHLTPDEAIQRTASLAAKCVRESLETGCAVTSITIAQTGDIDHDTGIVRFSNPLHWQHVPLKEQLQQHLKAALAPTAVPVLSIENDAKLAAFAAFQHYSSYDPGIQHLLYLSSGEGIGAGIISDGKILRGWRGSTGEVGHMPVDSRGLACRCGRYGCWETRVGLASVTSIYSALDPIRDPALSQWDIGPMLRDRFDNGDKLLQARIRDVEAGLERGLSILIDVLNPEVIVLSGWLSAFGDLFIPDLTRALRDRRLDLDATVRVDMSPLGPWAPSLGAAYAALEQFLFNPSLLSAPSETP